MNAYFDRFSNLNLDEILQITATDSAHSDELRRQGMGLKALSDKLDESIGAMASANGDVESGFDGASAQALLDGMTKLMRRGSEGHQSLRNQPDVFFSLSAASNATHRHMVDLREERDEWLRRWRDNPHDPRVRAKFGGSEGLYHAIRDDYDRQARHFMRESTGNYVDSVKNLKPMTAYDGPRLPREGEAQGPKGFSNHTTPGPSLGGTGSDTGFGSSPTLQSGVAFADTGSATNTVANNAQPIRSQPMGVMGGLGMTPTPPKAKKKRRKGKRDGKNEAPFEPTGQVTAPVLGSRDGATGEHRETGPTQRHDGLLPPVIGARPGVMGVTGRAAASTGGGKATPPPPQAPKRTFTGNVAGSRSVQRQHLAEGKVFRGGTAGAQRPEPPGYSRQPKTVHGDVDNPNRAVIRNSRAFAADPVPPASSRPEAEPSAPRPQPDREWQSARPVVAPVIRPRRPVEPEEIDHEPGPFLTHYNLGRER